MTWKSKEELQIVPFSELLPEEAFDEFECFKLITCDVDSDARSPSSVGPFSPVSNLLLPGIDGIDWNKNIEIEHVVVFLILCPLFTFIVL